MVICYARQSIEKKDSLSIDSQLEKGITLCKLNGWEYQCFSDSGYSGKNLERPGFQKMMALVRTGTVRKIICYKLDRISRNISDFSQLLLELQKYDCEFVSINENFDTTTPIGRAMLYISMVFAQMERESTSERVHDNYYYRTTMGFWGGGPAPYGYRLARITYQGKQHTVLEPDEEEAAVVDKIYALYEATGSVRAILTTLNSELHIRTRKGAEWTSRVLTDLLWKPLYAPNDMLVYNYLKSIGAAIEEPPEMWDGANSVDVYGKKDNPNVSKHKRCRELSDMYCNISRHAAIVSSLRWVNVQIKRNEQKPLPSRQGTGKNSYFTGLTKCGECGRGVSILHGRGGNYYVCSARKNLGKDSCLLPLLSQKVYDPLIITDIKEHFRLPEVTGAILGSETKSTVSPDYVLKCNGMMAEIAEIDKQIENLIVSLAAGNNIVNKYINERISSLDERKAELNRKIAKAGMKEFGENTEEKRREKIASILNSIEEILDTGTFEEIQSLCKILIERITFDKDKNVSIEYFI